jgi:hypothetical protein
MVYGRYVIWTSADWAENAGEGLQYMVDVKHYAAGHCYESALYMLKDSLYGNINAQYTTCRAGNCSVSRKRRIKACLE